MSDPRNAAWAEAERRRRNREAQRDIASRALPGQARLFFMWEGYYPGNLLSWPTTTSFPFWEICLDCKHFSEHEANHNHFIFDNNTTFSFCQDSKLPR
jgi:hypothetical protein